MQALHGVNLWLAIGGGVLLVLGLLVRRMIDGWDLTDVARDSVWQIARGKRTTLASTAAEIKLREIRGDSSAFGATRRTASTAIKHVLAQVFGLASLIAILAGLALLAAGFFWK